MQTTRLVRTLKATVGGLMVCRDPDAKAVQNVDLDISQADQHLRIRTYQMSDKRHSDPIFPSLNLAAVHSTCFVQIALTTCPTTNGT